MPDGATDVPGRGAFRAYERPASVLGAAGHPACRGSSPREGVRLRICRCRSTRRETQYHGGVPNGHRNDDSLFGPCRNKPPQRIYHHGSRWSALASRQGFDCARKHASARVATILPGAESCGTPVGRITREGIPKLRVRFAFRRHTAVATRSAKNAAHTRRSQVSHGLELDHKLTLTAKWNKSLDCTTITL